MTGSATWNLLTLTHCGIQSSRTRGWANPPPSDPGSVTLAKPPTAIKGPGGQWRVRIPSRSTFLDKRQGEPHSFRPQLHHTFAQPPTKINGPAGRSMAAPRPITEHCSRTCDGASPTISDQGSVTLLLNHQPHQKGRPAGR